MPCRSADCRRAQWALGRGAKLIRVISIDNLIYIYRPDSQFPGQEVCLLMWHASEIYVLMVPGLKNNLLFPFNTRF